MVKAKKGAKPALGAASEAQPGTAPGLPLFYEKPAALDSNRHAKAGLRSKATLAFARACNSVPLNAIEFIEAARCYPIVFSNEEAPFPVAVFGWERTNPFITAEDQWREDCYIPAYVRQYPFTLFEAPNSDKMYLCVDEASASFVGEINEKTSDVVAFYDEGVATDATKRALEFTNAFYQHTRITRAFCDDLKRHNLLAPYDSTVRIDGNEKHLKGFLMINETAFNALPPEVFLEFRAKGWLAFIYLSFASAINWKRLMEASKRAA
jgi:hypothetical protein